MPPPMFAPPPRCRGGGFARIIFTTIAVLIFVGSLGLNLLLLFFIGLNNNPGFLHSTTLIEGDSNTKIAVVPIDGLITSNLADKFDRILRELQKDSDIKALVIQVDSPGGTVTASDEIYHRIEQYKDITHNKVVIDMTGLAASGGYYLSAAGDYLMAEPTTMTGSIGVLMPQIDLTGLGDKIGLRDNSIHSTGRTSKKSVLPSNPKPPTSSNTCSISLIRPSHGSRALSSPAANTRPIRCTATLTRSPTAKSTPPKKPKTSA